MRWRLWMGSMVGVLGIGIYFVTAGGGAQAAPRPTADAAGDRSEEARSEGVQKVEADRDYQA
ncbi:MAG: hypothetical protein V3V20_00380, partial [Algisphaera sp.]